MKIHKHGTLLQDREYAFVCPDCRTHFTASKDEGKVITSWWVPSYVEISCPTCGTACTQEESRWIPKDPLE